MVPRNALAAVVGLLNETFESFSLTELSILLAVCEYEGLSVLSLARVCGMPRATASRAIRRLAAPGTPGALAPARGLVALVRAPNDNRSRYVFLTARGRGLCETIEGVLTDRSRRPLLVPAAAEGPRSLVTAVAERPDGGRAIPSQ